MDPGTRLGHYEILGPLGAGGMGEVYRARDTKLEREVVMKVLAIFSATMLPLSLIAGIYGMNFDNMPEVHSKYGYFVTLGLMFTIASGLLLYFWRRGWFGK